MKVIPLKPWYFQASSFQLLKLEYLLRWSLFTLRTFCLHAQFQDEKRFQSSFSLIRWVSYARAVRDGANLPRQLTSLTFTIVHCVILPSEDTEKKFMLLSRSSFCHFTWNEKEKKNISFARNWQRTSNKTGASFSEIFQRPPTVQIWAREVSLGCKDVLPPFVQQSFSLFTNYVK